MLRYIPYVLGLVVLTGATWWQAQIVDRWGMSSISVEDLQARFASVPLEIGPWKGVDHAVEKEVTKTAGAVAHVNRVYKNQQTGDEVALWLIVGHAKDIVRHTPDICYPAQGYRQSASEIQQTMRTADGSEAVFWTTRYTPESQLSAGQRRVFWAWSVQPEGSDEPKWEAPGSARRRFGNTRALYKMYFTSVVTNLEETAASSPCTEFAHICIPEVNNAIFGGTSAETANGVQDAPAAEDSEPSAATESTAEASSAAAADSHTAEATP
jgi:hypothetical protein